MLANFDILWLNPDYAVIASRKDVQEFAKIHTTRFGDIFIIVRGVGRYVNWTSIGAGMYKVYTTDTK